MAVEGDAMAEQFVLVDGPRPTESDHIYDHFFSEYASDGYDAQLIQQIHARRAQTGSSAALFYDALLSMALTGSAEQIMTDVYPPAQGKAGLVELIERISSSDFDRIRRMALLYYLVLDLDAYNRTQHVVNFVKRTGLPRSVRHATTGYWNMDNGNFRIAVSYLQEPDFVERILQTLTPFASIPLSEKDAEERAYAFASFLRLIGTSPTGVDPAQLQQAKVVAACWTQSIRAAWLLCRDMITEDGGEEQEACMVQCVARIVEHCFMPTPKPASVQALLALPLTTPEEALLSHVIINPTPNVSLSPVAHANAIDTLLARLINAGQYIEAVLLDRRVNASIGLLHLTGNTHGEGDNDRLRRLRLKRQNLVKSTLAVLTRVERKMLEVGDDVDVAAASAGYDGEDDAAGSEESWERIPQTVADATMQTDAGPSRMATTPLTASPVIRDPRAADKGFDPLVAAVVRSSPARIKPRFSTHSIGGKVGASGSPLSRSLAGSPNGSRQSHLRDSLDQLRSSPVRTRRTPMLNDISISSPLATARPYRLESTVAPATQSNGEEGQTVPAKSNDVTDTFGTIAVQDSDAEANGPMARLAQQIEEEMKRGSTSADEILRRSTTVANVSPFRVSGAPQKNAHSTLATARPKHRYEARYEIGQSPNMQAEDTPMQLEEPEVEVAVRRRGRRAPPAVKSRARTGKQGSRAAEAQEDDKDDGNTSVPGSFPGAQDAPTSLKDEQGEAKSKAPKRRTTAPRRTRQTLRAEENEEEGADDVATLEQTVTTIRKSKSAASNLARPKASTPLRRSTRLSVEPEAFDVASPSVTRQRSARSASPSKGTRASRRGASLAPTEGSDEEAPSSGGVMTRSSSRRKGGAGASIPGAF